MSNDGLGFEVDELEAFIQEYTELDRKVQRPDSIFSVLPKSRRERQYQNTLRYFLNPQRPHGFDYTLLEAFFDCIGFREFNLHRHHIEINDEVEIADGDTSGRIDLVICGGSALSDHPQWAVFLELKVGAEEGDQQTKRYAQTDYWDFSWFDSNRLNVDRLDESNYVYLKRTVADGPDDETGKFSPVTWADLAETIEASMQGSLFEYPNRSVIQLTDFIQSLKETEGMDSGINEDELNERLNLYFEYDRLIQQVEKASSRFETDFEDLSTYLRDNWERKLTEKYDFEGSEWKTSSSTNPKWQFIQPEYWNQERPGYSNTIALFFRHSPTTEFLRDRELVFRLRLPRSRNPHTDQQRDGESFNDIFAEKCEADGIREDIHDALETLDVDNHRLGSASLLVEKKYQLDASNLTGSYFEQLDRAVNEFCCTENDLLRCMNKVFKETYQDVFGEEPVGSFPGPLRKRE